MCCTVNSELYTVFFACTAGWMVNWLARLVLHCMNFELGQFHNCLHRIWLREAIIIRELFIVTQV